MMPTLHPTAKQTQVLDTIKAFMSEHGRPPTYREIGAVVILSPAGVRTMLKGLEARGLLTWNTNEARSIQLRGAK